MLAQEEDKTRVYLVFLHTPQNTVRKRKGFPGNLEFIPLEDS